MNEHRYKSENAKKLKSEKQSENEKKSENKEKVKIMMYANFGEFISRKRVEKKINIEENGRYVRRISTF